MKPKSAAALPGLLALFLLAGGCSTVNSRIADHRSAYETWPPAVQEKVAAGRIDVGFTPEQVKTALGEPERVATRTTAAGQSEAWIYRNRSPRIGFGIGFGSFSRSSAVGVGVQTGGWALRPDETRRVVFDNGKVVAIDESPQRE